MSVSFLGVSLVSAVSTEKDSKPGYNVSGLLSAKTGVTWIEKEQFDHYHAPMACLPFGLAMEALLRGCQIYRSSWPAGTYLHLLELDGPTGASRRVSLSRLHHHQRRERVWSPTNEEMLATNWTVGANQQHT